jgi:hypothetical protein
MFIDGWNESVPEPKFVVLILAMKNKLLTPVKNDAASA